MLFSRKSESRDDPVPALSNALEPQRVSQSPSVSEVARHGDGTHTQSFIDSSLTIVGDLHADGDVRLDGRICGNVTCAQLIVGKDATITGAVTAHEAIVRGRVTGTIRSPVVIIQSTAHVESEITYSMLAIDDGATFEGAAHRCDDPLDVAAAPAASEDLPRALAAEGAPGSCGAGASSARAPAAATEPAGASAALPVPVTNGLNPPAKLGSDAQQARPGP